MVCEKCEKKQATLVTPDVWKSGARNTMESGGRKMGSNTLLASKASRIAKPYSKGSVFAKCKTCSAGLQSGHQYCQRCAYKDGICSICGVKILDTKFYRQSKT
eukprot:TRINITY_DN5822_c0_g1_i1.p1 TRINITY_DN5822_c0_g1~~TRINITY_DN5822_c0_g1_i1.p1  ORF type:complete len:103 (-),score=5.46 TRINITY_DN5822_c0_g1_i1:68-376(-)